MPANDSLIVFSDQRQREHRRRQSVITVDDTDVILHKRATRRSILYGGHSQGPKFWNQLKSAWNNHGPSPVPSPVPSPTSVRDVHELDAKQEQAIFNAKPTQFMAIAADKTDLHCCKEDASQTTGRTSTTSTSSMDTSIRPFLSVWDRLDAWSLNEHRRVQEYHDTVRQQNEKLAASPENTVGVPEQPFSSVTDASKSTSMATKTVAPVGIRGRLRRQSSWNGRDSNRDLIQARGSVIAEADDCSFRHLLCVLDGEVDHGEELRDEDLNGGRDGNLFATVTIPSRRKEISRSKADQCVMNLVM